MKDWQKSGLRIGDRLRIPEELFVQEGKRCTAAIYTGETPAGLILQLEFIPGIGSTEYSWNYKYFVNWASIYCGHIKLFVKSTGEQIRAKRLNDPLEGIR